MARATGSQPPWWDDFPRVVITSSVATAQTYYASAAMNGVANDPGWGLWFNNTGDSGAAMRQSFDAAGIRSLSYNEAFGDAATPIVELQWDATRQQWAPRNSHWNWQAYSGGPIAWAGAWSWFDSFLADPPAMASEPGYFARPFTRLHPSYGGPPMKYPDGTIATGFFDHDPTDPRKSRVYDAGAAKDVFGQLTLGYGYNTSADDPTEPHAGSLWVPADGKFSSSVYFAKDAACPHWADYAHASTRAAVQLTGLHGTWTDNFGPWDSFGSGGPVHSAFGDWSVARFRTHLTNHFTESQLKTWGVIATNATLADIAAFDARAYFCNVASNKFGWTGTNLNHAAWRDNGWADEPVWRAFTIFKRQTGTEALTNHDVAVKSAAAQAGATDFALLANDIAPASFGWARGSFDLTSAELSLGWNLTAGARGFGLPPFGRLAPYYKAAREQGRSRFVTVWLYNDGYVAALTNRAPVEALFYEMLATHALPTMYPGKSQFAGTPAVQQNFFRFVSERAAPAFGQRVPVEEVGIYFSSSSILSAALPGDAFDFAKQDHQLALWGWGTALSELHYQYRVVPEWKLTRELLLTLRVLLVPNVVAFEPADVATLESWVRDEGGCLIVTGDSGARLGESGNFDTATNLVLAPLTGVTNYATTPVAATNHLGAGVVRYVRSNLGRAYYDADAAGRVTQLPTLAGVMAGAFSLLGTQPVLETTNAPTTTGLTLYEDMAAVRTFVDLNNVNVNPSNFTTTPSPALDVSLRRPAWLTNGAPPFASILSPDGALPMAAPDFSSNRVQLRLPSVTNFLSVVLQPAWLALTVISPTNGGVFPDGSVLNVTVVPAGNTTVTNVQLFANGGRFATFSVPPYSAALSNLASGQYTFTASVADDHALTATSAPVTITIGAGSPPPPALSATLQRDTLTLTWPAANGDFQLYTTTDLAPPAVWTPATNTPLFTNNQITVPLTPAPEENRFYRLQHR